MNYLRVLPIQGLFHEFSSPERLYDKETYQKVENQLLDCNNIFWAEILKTQNVRDIVAILKMQPFDKLIPQYKAIYKSEDLFIKKIEKSLQCICDQSNTPEVFFDYLESLSILCKLYSDYVFYPYELTRQNGFVLNEYSSKEIMENHLNPKKNPYLDTINKIIIPIILNYKPDLLFLEGKLNYCNLAIASIIKKYLPKTHISVTRHSSEYYSLNKITDYLLRNETLFSIVDSIVLEYFDETESMVMKAIEQPNSLLKNVNNIIFKDKKNNQIIQTASVCPNASNNVEIFFRKNNQYQNLEISPYEMVDFHLEPFVKCHWNKCSFCGINKKYTYDDYTLDAKSFYKRLDSIQEVVVAGINYIWFIDEALLPEKLKLIAEYLINHNLKLFWQARCRIDSQLLDDELISLLSISGLKELRMGLESASQNVLNDMHKFDADFSLEMVEDIVKTYTQAGISIHFPMIIGFPTETIADRQRTYEFLGHLKDSYELFSFNINIFQLDISSEIFKNWAKYSIYQISIPCEAEYFLGNWAIYESQTNKEDLRNEQDQFMREKMYPWMPSNAILKPHIFYRLSETIRNTLVWEAQNIRPSKCYYYGSMCLEKASNLTIINENNTSFLIYNWNNHHYMRGNRLLIDVLNEWSEEKTAIQGIQNLITNNSMHYDETDLVLILKKLIAHGYLVEIGKKENLSTEDFYNDIYQTENYPYTVEPDIMLRIWQDYLLPGKVLDLGIGMGKDVDYLLKKGNEIVGVDFSKTAIDKLNQRYSDMHCRFINADIRNFDIEPETYSLIICSMVLSHITESEIIKITEKIINGLISGGCVYICDISEYDPIHHYANGLRQVIKAEDLLNWFESLELIIITQSYQKETKRIDMDGYFGLIKYIGKKK